MRKESLKKDGSKNGILDESEIENGNGTEPSDANNLNGDAVDPLGGADNADVAVAEAPKKKGKKGKEAAGTVVEVSVPKSDAADKEADDADEEEEDYEVDEIVSHKIEKKKKFYLVRWKNYGAESDTWEPESSLSCPDIIKKYTDANPEAESVAPKPKKEKKAAKAPATPAKKSSRVSVPVVKKDDADEDDEENYEVEDIIEHKTKGKKTLFLIRWKGFGPESDTWEPESTLSCPEIVEKYRKNNEIEVTKKSAKKEKKEKKEKVYEVKLVVDEKIEKGQTFYLVRWKGYKGEDDTWEPESSLSCPELIQKYKDGLSKKRPAAAPRGSPKKPKYVENDEEEDIVEVPVQKSKKRAAPAKVEEDYEVESIADDKVEKGKKFFLVKWKGWPASDNTWEPESSLSCPEIVKKYLATKKTKKVEKKSNKADKKKATTTTSPKKTKKSPKKNKKSEKDVTEEDAAKENEDEEEQDWEVEQVIDVKYNEDGTKNFLIRWKGCEPSSDTWEPESNLGCPDLINKFMNKVDEVPKKKSRKA